MFKATRRTTARPLRLDFPDALYQLTARGNARRCIIPGDADRDRSGFLGVLAHTYERLNWICNAYCLMTNHGVRICHADCLMMVGAPRDWPWSGYRAPIGENGSVPAFQEPDWVWWAFNECRAEAVAGFWGFVVEGMAAA